MAKNEYWETLLNYESLELVKKQFKAVHGREANSGKAHEICDSFIQARGYMQAAQASDKIVRPLLTYYSVIGLSRALTLFRSANLRENGLEQAHGLSVDSWGPELARDGGCISALKLKINGQGTLSQLIEATEHKSYLRNNSSKPNQAVFHDKPNSGVSINFGDVLSRLPEIRDTHQRWCGDKNMVAVWPQGALPDGRGKLRVDLPYTYDDVKAVLGEVERVNDGSVLNIIVDGSITPHMSDVVGHWNVGSLVLMTKLPGNIELSKIATAFVVSYALGMLVRYYPSQWIAMLHNRQHTGALPSLLAALQHIEKEYPRFVLEFLEKPC